MSGICGHPPLENPESAAFWQTAPSVPLLKGFPREGEWGLSGDGAFRHLGKFSIWRKPKIHLTPSAYEYVCLSAVAISQPQNHSELDVFPGEKCPWLWAENTGSWCCWLWTHPFFINELRNQVNAADPCSEFRQIWISDLPWWPTYEMSVFKAELFPSCFWQEYRLLDYLLCIFFILEPAYIEYL